ncbi:MAG: SufE family protein, partial [Bacteroidota bacterium]
PLDPDYAPLRDAGLNMVHECQSPVFLMAETDAGTLRLHVDVPREAPTARGFTSVLVDLFDGKPVEVLASAPEDLVHELGLTQLLGMQRKRGLAGIYYRVRSALS